MPGDTTSLYRGGTPRNTHILGLLLGLGLACADRDLKGACLPPADPDGAKEIELAGGSSLAWYCADPPPSDLLTGEYHTTLVWVEGEACDPCDVERIAGRAMDQVCARIGPEYEGESTPAPIRLLCGPVDYYLDSWDRKGCVYAVADSAPCPVF